VRAKVTEIMGKSNKDREESVKKQERGDGNEREEEKEEKRKNQRKKFKSMSGD